MEGLREFGDTSLESPTLNGVEQGGWPVERPDRQDRIRHTHDELSPVWHYLYADGPPPGRPPWYRVLHRRWKLWRLGMVPCRCAMPSDVPCMDCGAGL